MPLTASVKADTGKDCLGHCWYNAVTMQHGSLTWRNKIELIIAKKANMKLTFHDLSDVSFELLKIELSIDKEANNKLTYHDLPDVSFELFKKRPAIRT